MNRQRRRQIATCDATSKTPRFDQDVDHKRDHIVGRQRQIRQMRLFLFISIDIHVDSVPNIRQQLVPTLQNRQRQRRIEMVVKLKIGAVELSQRGHKLRLTRRPFRYVTNEVHGDVQILQREIGEVQTRLVKQQDFFAAALVQHRHDSRGNHAKQALMQGLGSTFPRLGT